MTVEEDCFKLLEFLYEQQKLLKDDVYIESTEVQKGTGLTPTQINTVADLLNGRLIETISCYGTAPFSFKALKINGQGKTEIEKRKLLQAQAISKQTPLANAIADFAAFFGSQYGQKKIEKLYSSSFTIDEIRNLDKTAKIIKILNECNNDPDSLQTRIGIIINNHPDSAKKQITELRSIIKRFGLDLVDDLTLIKSCQNQKFEYEVALSFAGEDRKNAEELYVALDAKHVKVFYDEAETATIWGKDLYEYLSELYSKRSRFCVMLISKYYAQKMWTTHERKAAQSRALKQADKEYILPIRLDDTEIPGLLDTVSYLDWTTGVDKIVQCIIEKLKK